MSGRVVAGAWEGCGDHHRAEVAGGGGGEGGNGGGDGMA
ncbi:Hypothetical protein CAP_8012 [Chondromyces apiculatus DSM 436]|uniref:Uncharacterized protein n=1 Tax=Chondromyces apiculatus DSM 436 TaxID=1192034 RepID=A0A017SXW0_9BACT|nr:Hypothetical protein CAP_8012 [Chondromyces apiculatus DSM 436]